MKISPIAFLNTTPKTTQPARPNLAPMGQDTVSFSAMKKSKFSGFDLAFVNMTKAPIDKFNNADDLKAYAKEKLDALLELEQYRAIKGVTKERDRLLRQDRIDDLNKKRMPLIEAWKKCLTQESGVCGDDPVSAYIIFSSIMKEVGAENTKYPPLLDRRALVKTMRKIVSNFTTRVEKNGKEKTEENRNYQFNFYKEYQNTLQILTMTDNDDGTGETMTGWVKIPSYKNDPENFDKNVARLKILSHPSWCTKNKDTESHLEKGDFHIYLDNGKPRLGVWFSGDKITEIQGPRNNGKVPLGYFDIAKDYVLNVLKDNDSGKKLIEETEKIKGKFDIKKAEFEAAGIDVNSESLETQRAIFEFFGFGVKIKETSEGQKLAVSSLKQPEDKDLSFSDFEINENALVKDVVEIEGNADISGLEIASLPSLKIIGGNLECNPRIRTYPLLESIGDGIMAIDARNVSFPVLKSIGRVANFERAENISLPVLESIGELAIFNGTQNIDAPSLKFVGGNLHVKNSSLLDTDLLDRVTVQGKINK